MHIHSILTIYKEHILLTTYMHTYDAHMRQINNNVSATQAEQNKNTYAHTKIHWSSPQHIHSKAINDNEI